MKSAGKVKSIIRAFAIIIGFLLLFESSPISSAAPESKRYFPLIFRVLPGGPSITSPILITEVLYNPLGLEPGLEWFELFNRSSQPQNLGFFKVGDSETKGDGEGMYSFPQGLRLSPGRVLVVANQAEIFTQNYGYPPPDFELSDSSPSIPDLIKYRSWSGGVINLSNSGDELILLDQNDAILDSLSWGNSPFVFSNPIPAVKDGHSVERKPANMDRNHAGDWVDQIHPDPSRVDLATPTLLPSPTSSPTLPPTPTLTPTPVPLFVINEIHADPDPSSGDANGDGGVDSVEDEFVELINVSPTSLDISDWSFRDVFGIRHIFPAGSEVGSGCGVIIFGGGTPTGSFGNFLVQVASTGSLGLNDHGDAVSLLDGDSQVVSTYSYGIVAGDDQSITRDPDIIGTDPMVKHSTATGSGGTLFSPGRLIDGGEFVGCSE